MSEPRISIIVPVRNNAATIERCLEGIFSQSCQLYEVIIVDGHSSDGTMEKVREFPVRVLSEDFQTRAGGCQVGLEHAKGEYVAFTDADCIPDRDWLTNLAKELEADIIGVGGAIKNIGNGFWIRSINYAYGTFLGSANSVQGRIFKDKRLVNSISGSNSLYRRQDVLKVGGFNTSLPGAEDTELNSRLLKHGKLLYSPEAVILHDHRRGLTKFARQIFRYGQERAIARKSGLPIVPPLLVLLLLLSLVFTRWLLPSAFILYILILIAMGIRFAVEGKDIKYLVSIPIVYLIEHSLYTLGFWTGLIKPGRAGAQNVRK